jgi:5'-methylthioinosine phosphorylase
MSGLTAIIGGSALAKLPGLAIEQRKVVRTPFGEPSSTLMFGNVAGSHVVFLSRHGYASTIAPHAVNYRANLWALESVGVTHVLAVSAVGGIHDALMPRGFAVPDQIIDYTRGRAATFMGEANAPVLNIDFTDPFDPHLRKLLVTACDEAGKIAMDGGTYACMSGPRFETAAEIRRLKNDGADMVGLTVMPEAILARELNLPYASLAVVANRAAGLSGRIEMSDVRETLDAVLPSVQIVLSRAAQLLEHGR